MDFSKEDHRDYVDRREGRRKGGDEDSAGYTRADHEAYRKKVEAEEARQAEESRKRLARAAYKSAGGKDAEFEKDYAELQKQERTTYLLEAARRAREAQSESRISRI